MIYAGTGVLGLNALTITTGASVPFVMGDTTSPGCTLGVSTYYFPIGSERDGIVAATVDVGLQMRWNAAAAGTATIEVCNWPATLSGASQGGPVITDYDSSATGWSQLDPTLAGQVFAAASGSGNSMTKYTCTLGGTAAGLAIWNIPDLGFRRLRIKLVLSAGGVVWVMPWGKLGS